MELRDSRRYSSDVLQSVLFQSDPHNMSGIIYSARDTYVPQPPVLVYNPYISDMDHLDKTLFLEKRMRIQENIINKHKTEAERSLAREKGTFNHGRVLSKHLSVKDLNQNKNSYSSIFSKQMNKSNTELNETLGNDANIEDVWLPKDMIANGNIIPHPPSIETLDTARGKAKYALVRLSSSGKIDIPTMYLESVSHPNLQSTVNLKIADPNNFIGSENRAILEKVNGIQSSQNEKEFNVQDVSESTKTVNNKNKEINSKKLTKKISLNDLNLPEETEHPLMSRKAKLKTQSKVAHDGTNHEQLSEKLIPERKQRRPSRDTNQSYSRKSTLINSRQSSQSGGKNVHSDTPLSFHNVDIIPVVKRSRMKTEMKPQNVNDENFRKTSISPKNNDLPKPKNKSKKQEIRQTSNNLKHEFDSTDNTQPVTKLISKKTNVEEKSRPNGNSKEVFKSEEKTAIAKTSKHPYDKTKELNYKMASTSEHQHKQANKSETSETNKSHAESGKSLNHHSNTHKDSKNSVKSNENTSTRVAKNGLRKTDSFKMMGNSSHFFGYCSVPEDDVSIKKPKSILKKTSTKEERPDTA